MEYLQEIIKRKPSQKDSYQKMAKDVYSLSGLTPSELVEIARKEQNLILKEDDGTYHNLDMEDRTITRVQKQYYEFLKNKGLMPTTQKMYIVCFRALFPSTIQLPESPRIHIPRKRIRKRDIPTYEDVQAAMDTAQKTSEKLLILTPAVSGLRISDFIDLTFQDLIDGSSMYHDGTLKGFLNCDPKKMVICLDLEPKKTEKRGNLCITFLPPWWCELLFQWVEDRKRLYKKYKRDKYLVTPEAYIFPGKYGGHIHPISANKQFNRISERMNLGKDRNGVYNKFRAHNLRKLFSTTCRRNIGKVAVDNKNMAATFSVLDAVSIMTGHTPPNMNNSEVYDAVEDDSEDSYLRQLYTGLLPYLQPKDTPFNLKQEVEELKTRKDELQDHIDSQNRIMDDILVRVRALENEPLSSGKVKKLKNKFC